jgi:hypothetical protein
MGGRASLPVGSGTATAQVSGVLSVNTTQAGTAADTNETDLWTYSLPANTLNANGKAVRITVSGTFANTATVKTAKLYFGTSSVTVNDATASPQNIQWYCTLIVFRTGAATQIRTKWAVVGATNQFVSVATPTGQDTTAAITIKVTGQNGTANADDIVFTSAVVEVLN